MATYEWNTPYQHPQAFALYPQIIRVDPVNSGASVREQVSNRLQIRLSEVTLSPGAPTETKCETHPCDCTLPFPMLLVRP